MSEQEQWRPAPYEVAPQECPAIHVGLTDGLDGRFYHWVAVGAEEEGVPCRKDLTTGTDPVAVAYSAAQNSRLGVGIGAGSSLVVLHESHMPPDRPVLTFEVKSAPEGTCRLIGGNAARLVMRVPLRFEEEEARLAQETERARRRLSSRPVAPKAPPPEPETEPIAVPSREELKAIIRAIILVLIKRGIT